MATSKFLTLFSSCLDHEVAAFHKLLRQSHKNREKLLELYTHARDVRELSDAKALLEPAYCSLKIYGKDDARSQKSIMNMMSELHLMLKNYLISERLKKDELESRLLWLSILSEKGLENEFKAQILSGINEYRSVQKASVMDYWNLISLQHRYYYTFTTTTALDGALEIQKNLDALDEYMQIIKSRMLCEALHLRDKVLADFPIDPLIDRLRSQSIDFLGNHLLLTLYKELQTLLETKDLSQFDRVTSMISKNAAKIGPKEMDEFLLYLNSFLSAIARMNHAEEDIERAHRLNKIALANKVYFHQGKMLLANYLNIVTVACKVKDFGWALQFGKACKALLPSPIKEEAFLLSKAIIHFEKREYREILRLLKGIESKDVYIQIRVKTFMVVCHFELKESGGDLREYCTATELYLKRNLKLKPLQDAVRSVLNMVSIVKMLESRDLPREKIREEITSTPLLVFRQWLLEKVATYKQK